MEVLGKLQLNSGARSSEYDNYALPNLSGQLFNTDNESCTSNVLFDFLGEMDSRVKKLLQEICLKSDFATKYELSSPRKGEPYIYLLTTVSSPWKFTIEAFPKIEKPTKEDLTKGPCTFKFHKVFEKAIERYAESQSKPNEVLRETRSGDFCYPVTIHVEAVPQEKCKRADRLLLLREFQILSTIWENYRHEFRNKKCTHDHLVGFPMPFEFNFVTGTDYDLATRLSDQVSYHNISGALVDSSSNFKLPLSSATTMSSTLCYMTVEKLGPSVTYLIDLMKTQNRAFTLSSAFMVYDQLLCRLIVMHKYGIVHGDLNTDCLRFGSRNACNVLYISDFSTGCLVPTRSAPSFLFHDRFVSTQRIKSKIYHFAHDLESAFYIFLLMAIGHLPWDNRLRTDNQYNQVITDGQRTRDLNPLVEMSFVQRDKERFWENPGLVQRLVNSREFELHGALYHNFIEDLIMSIYTKVRDIVNNTSRASRESFMRDIGNYGTAANNAYMGVRKVIGSYFRFETLSPLLKDSTAEAKVGLLKSHDPKDQRIAWDLSTWCWNYITIEVKSNQSTPVKHRSLILQTE